MDQLPLPKKIDVQSAHEHEEVITIEPCFPGYGTTLGNTLRRVLLSSLPGAAVTAMRITTVDHEFSTIAGVKEDVVALLLNVKLLRFRLHSDGPVTVTLKATGEKHATGADIQTTSDIEVVNPEQHVATLTDPSASLEIELTVGPGRGYVPVENREKEKLPLGTIAVDAIYTPVKNVNFQIEHVRVEQMTNYDRLVLTVRTDGTIAPTDAVRKAAEILEQHFQFITANVPSAPASTVPAPKKRRSTKSKAEPQQQESTAGAAATE